MELIQPRANVLIVLGGCMWGVYWLPLRHLEGMGFTGASTGIALYTGCLLLLLPFTLGFGAVIRTHLRVLLFSSLLTGAAISFFTTAVVALTDVIRAILLFYLTPAWGTILGLVFLGATFAAMGQGAQAEQAYGRAIKLDPKNAEIRANLARYYQGIKAHDQAIQSFQTALTYAPNNQHCIITSG